MAQIRPNKSSLKSRVFCATCLALGGSFATLPTANGQTPETEFALAAGFYARTQWAESAAALKAFIADHPHAPQASAASFFLGEAYVQQRDFESAYPAYQRYLNGNPNQQFAARASFRLGECAYRTGNVKAALRSLEAFVADNPKNDLIEFALPYLGEMRLTRNEPQLAQSAFETALKYYPRSELSNQSRLGLAKALQAQGAMEDAQRLFSFVVSGPDSEFTAEANRQLGIIKFKQGDYDAARKYLQTAVANSSGTAKAESGYWLARTEMAAEDHAAAVALVKALSTDDLPVKVGSIMLFDGAVAATKIDDDQTAQRWLTQLREKYPENHLVDEALLLQLKLAQKAGNDQGVIELAKVFKTNCGGSQYAEQVAEMAGRSFYAIGDFDNTVLTYQTLLSESTHQINSETITNAVREQRSKWLYLQSLGYLGMKQYDQAIKELKLAEAYNENPELATLIDLAFATAYFGSQQYSQAVLRYHNFLTHHQSDQEDSSGSQEFVRAACEMTICYSELKQWEDTRQSFEIMKTRSDHELVMQTTQYLAEQAYDAGQKELAADFYQFMAQPGNEQPVVSRGLSGLAWVYMGSEDAAATPVFERLVAEYPDGVFAAKATMARAKFLEDKQDIAGAKQSYALVIDRFDSQPIANVARLRYANLLHKSGGKQDLATAQTLLKDYLQSSSDKASADEALYMLGWVMHDQGDTKQGIVRFQRLVDQHPDSKYWSDAAFRVAQQHIRDGKETEADALVTKIIAQSDDESNVPKEVLARARYQKAQKAAAAKDWERVSSLMEQVIEDGDSDLTMRAKYWLAESLYQQQMFNEASQRFAAITDLSAIERKLQPWVRLRMAQCLGKLERWDDAGVVADDALHQFGDFANDYEFVFVTARSKEARGLFDDAEKLYTEVIESENGKASETAAIAQWRIGEMHFHKEQYETAIDAYYRVDSLYNHPKWRSAAILQAGKCQEHLGNWKHAVKLYTQILDKYPDSKLAESAQERLQLVTRMADKPVEEKRR